MVMLKFLVRYTVISFFEGYLLCRKSGRMAGFGLLSSAERLKLMFPRWCSARAKLRTRKAPDSRAPWNVAPRAFASSVFRVRPSCLPPNASFRRVCNIGIRDPPPISSTESISSSFRPDFSIARLKVPIARSMSPAASSSNLARVTTVLKSRSSQSPSTETRASLLALKVSLAFCADRINFATALSPARLSMASTSTPVLSENFFATSLASRTS
mmetsp:Transcript_66423/g.117934  ORF Transcript_66423/g.117934 Transcript_66423/m.117934 type:complete len:214 (-) Transcript_66423:757-1398(-)